jgi:hypothetical protein
MTLTNRVSLLMIAIGEKEFFRPKRTIDCLKLGGENEAVDFTCGINVPIYGVSIF